MKLLGIESSGLVASVAVAEDGVLLGEYTTNYKKTHSQTLLPMLDELKRMTELDLSSIDAIAISAGPGSFTGLRIGSATAKGLGLALDKPLVEVPTLEGLAYNVYGCHGLICPIMDARRNQVYTGIYEFTSDEGQIGENGAREQKFVLKSVMTQTAMDIHELLKELERLNRRVIFLGDGVPVYGEVIRKECAVPFSFAPAHLNAQRAGSVVALGEVYYAQGRTISSDEHGPEYLRKSQAEREKEERSAGVNAK